MPACNFTFENAEQNIQTVPSGGGYGVEANDRLSWVCCTLLCDKESSMQGDRGQNKLNVIGYSAEEFIKYELSLVPEVIAIFTVGDAKYMHIFVAVADLKKEVRYRVYDREREIIDALAPLEFDFSILPWRDGQAHSLIPDGKLVYQRP